MNPAVLPTLRIFPPPSSTISLAKSLVKTVALITFTMIMLTSSTISLSMMVPCPPNPVQSKKNRYGCFCLSLSVHSRLDLYRPICYVQSVRPLLNGTVKEERMSIIAELWLMPRTDIALFYACRAIIIWEPKSLIHLICFQSFLLKCGWEATVHFDLTRQFRL